ncbi:MAG: ATP-binding protein [Thermodesulfovibrionales bacterium]|nr:ATP-binding protein [Thermodesulfovibrionales bacterium]
MKKRGVISALILLLLAVAASVLEFNLLRMEGSTPLGNLLFLLFLNLNIAALGVLIFFVAKNLLVLYSERKRRVPGYRFKTKMVLLFVALIAIPTGLLLVAALGLGSNYIERLFSPQFRQPLESSIEVAKVVYNMEREKTLEAAAAAASGLALPSGYNVIRLAEMPDDATVAVMAAFGGGRNAEVISEEGRDIVRAAVPAVAPEAGVVVVEHIMPPAITASVKEIKETYEDYIKLEAWSVPLKLNFLLILGFAALMVISLAMWAALRIAGRITEPVRGLVEATEAVAEGNLSVSVAAKSGDEMGLLIESFNRMVREIREGREFLQTAYAESDRRRLFIENIVENIQSGVLSLDPAGNVMMINSAALRILCVTAQDVVGKNYGVILSGIESSELLKHLKDINLKTFSAVEHAEVGATIDGRKVILRVSIAGLRNTAGGYRGLLVVFDDLTDIIKAQRALAWQEVARRIAHEIKNPLTPIKLSTERMLKKWQEKDGEFEQIFERSTSAIVREVASLQRLVDEFSRFGKMPEINKRPTGVRAVAEEAISLYSAYKNLSITLEPGDATADIDAEQFKRVLINLFENAVSAAGEAGSITVRIRPDYEANRLFVDVGDNGPGIKDSDKEKLFLPYFSTKKHGTGLGLAIADRIIAEHGGYIRVMDNKPRGSIFTVELPMKEG